MSFAIRSARACTAELLFTSRNRKTVPVLRVYTVRDHSIAEVSHGSEHVSAGLEVRRTHVSRLDPDDVDQRSLKLLHLGGELGDTHAVECLRVSPGVRGNLMTTGVGGLDCCCAIVDATVQSACEEESGLGSCSVQSLDQLLSVLTRSIIEGEGEDAGFAALAVDDTSCWTALSGFDEGRGNRRCGGYATDGKHRGEQRREMHLGDSKEPFRLAVVLITSPRITKEASIL